MFFLFFLLHTSLIGYVFNFENSIDLGNNNFYINWKGPLEENELDKEKEVMMMRSSKNELYQCVLPFVLDEETRLKNDKEFSSAHLELELLKPLFENNLCIYKLDVYWNYEFCYGKHIRQFHEQKEPPTVQEYFLGYYSKDKFKQDLEKQKKERERGEFSNPLKKKVFGMEQSFYEVVYEDGTTCDLTGLPRKSHVLFVCFKNGRSELYDLKETSSCVYEIVILTSLLCQHPKYGPKEETVNTIDCHSLASAPKTPRNLELMTRASKGLADEKNKFLNTIWDLVQVFTGKDTEKLEDEELVKEALKNEKGSKLKGDEEDKTKLKQPSTVQQKQQSEIASTTLNPQSSQLPPQQNQHNEQQSLYIQQQPSSRQILYDFLNGLYCIEGGTGWWRHELCFGRFINQFHVGKQGKTVISLGKWDKSKHLKWLEENPQKRPTHPNNVNKHSYYLYTEGDYCEKNQKKRFVEVRLDCVHKAYSSNSIALYLVENVVCQYKLVVESTLFCEAMKSADEDGTLHFKP